MMLLLNLLQLIERLFSGLLSQRASIRMLLLMRLTGVHLSRLWVTIESRDIRLGIAEGFRGISKIIS